MTNLKAAILITFGMLTFFNGYSQKSLRINQTLLEQMEHWQTSNMNPLPTKVSLKNYTPAVGNQGNSNACVGWAIGYGAMTIQHAISLGLTDQTAITRNAFSAEFIYQQIPKESCTARVTLLEGVTVAMNVGNLNQTTFNTANTNCTTRISSYQKAKARQNIIAQTTLLFKKENTTKEKVTATKAALAKGFPVVLSMSVRKNFYQLKGGKYWWPNIGNTTPMGGHALVVIAYDNQKQAFQLMNSWGTEWGRGGFVWIKYKDFARFAKHAFCLAKL